jgi:MFS family permease
VADQDQTTSYPPRGGAYVMLIILIASYIMALIDRQILALLVAPVRASLHIDDVRFSLLQGLSFAAFYCVLGLPLGRLADRTNRKWLIAAGMLVWSLATMACAFATTFPTLFFARMMVGVGEAALAPAAYSLLADSFEPDRRVRVNALFSMGSVVGGGLAFIVGGMALTLAHEISASLAPTVFEPWRIVFLIVGAPGLVLVAALLLFVREPKRLNDGPLPPLRAALAQLWKLRTELFPFYACATLLAIIMHGNLAWLPSSFIRGYGMAPRDAGLLVGSSLVIGAIVGIFGGASLTERLSRAGVPEAPMWVIFGSAIAICIPVAGPMFLHDPRAGAVAAGLYFMIQNAYFGGVIASIQKVTPQRLRAVNVSFLFLSMNLIGLAAGTTIIAWVSQHLLGDKPGSIGNAIVAVSWAAAVGSILLSSGPLRRALSKRG